MNYDRKGNGHGKPRRSLDICEDPILDQALKPLWQYINRKTTVEVFVNEPCRVIVDERGGGKQFYDDSHLTIGYFKKLMSALSNNAGLQFTPDHPSLSTTLPFKHRFQGVVGPSLPQEISVAIRCKHPFKALYEDFGLSGRPLEYLLDLVRQERTIVIAGSTNTGKTTLLNLLLKEANRERRIITMEDTEELDTDHFKDRVTLLAARDENNAAPGKLSYRQLYDHCMRASPQLIVFGEISTQNAFAALGLLNTGHRGMIMTIHADTPEQVIRRKFTQNVAWSGRERMDDIPEYLRDMVDLVVQIKRRSDGMRVVTDMWEPANDNWILKNGVAA